MPLQATSGAASYDAFGGGVRAVNYIEDVFSTYLWTTTGSSVSIVNGIDLSTKGGLVWEKCRSVGVGHNLTDTVRGTNKTLETNSTAAESTGGVQTFSTNGFTTSALITARTYCSWTFRKQPKFFDIVTYTGTGSNRTIAHNLGSVPGCIIVKSTNQVSNWQVYHRGLTSAAYGIQLNDTAAQASFPTFWNSTAPTSTEFSVGTSSSVNLNGGSFVAYIFAHDAGGFGLTGTDNVISCGTFTTDGAGAASVTLGYEPQFVIGKRISGLGGWIIQDTMRGMYVTGEGAYLSAQSANAESAVTTESIKPNATGFTVSGTLFQASSTMIYIAIRRGPMKVPTSGTSVFGALTRTGTGANATISGLSFPVDMLIGSTRDSARAHAITDRLRGAKTALVTNTTAADTADATGVTGLDRMDGFTLGTDVSYTGTFNGGTSESKLVHYFRRAPSFFDEVCCTQTTTVNHNLGVTPELVIYKSRSAVDQWYVCTANNGFGILNFANAWAATGGGSGLGASYANATSTTINGGTAFYSSGVTLVAYLFATCAGVSKVFSYTGNGSSQTINCGFTSSARFVLIKRTNASGDWYVWDTARGIVAGNDPHLSLNTTVAEVTTDDTIDTDSTGFVVNQVAATNVNVTSATYIGLAIA